MGQARNHGPQILVEAVLTCRLVAGDHFLVRVHHAFWVFEQPLRGSQANSSRSRFQMLQQCALDQVALRAAGLHGFND